MISRRHTIQKLFDQNVQLSRVSQSVENTNIERERERKGVTYLIFHRQPSSTSLFAEHRILYKEIFGVLATFSLNFKFSKLYVCVLRFESERESVCDGHSSRRKRRRGERGFFLVCVGGGACVVHFSFNFSFSFSIIMMND